MSLNETSVRKSAAFKPDAPSEDEQLAWLVSTSQGDRNAFNHIVEQYQRPIYNLCYRMLNDAAEAEDAAQEVFLRAFLKLDTYDQNRKFSSWLFAIASHYCLDRLKKRRLTSVYWDDIPQYQAIASKGANQPERAFISQETTREVNYLLQTLQPEYRSTVILKYWYNLNYEEIAEIMNTTVGAIKSRLFRARRTLAGHILSIGPAVEKQTALKSQRRYIVMEQSTLSTAIGGINIR